jgi:hypothetical protein
MARHSLTKPDVRNVPVFIYALLEPGSNEIRYVGRSADPEARLRSHVTNVGACAPFRLRAWALQLAATKKTPGLRVLRVVPPGADSAPWEAHYIRKHETPRLLNVRGTSDVGARMIEVWTANGTHPSVIAQPRMGG